MPFFQIRLTKSVSGLDERETTARPLAQEIFEVRRRDRALDWTRQAQWRHCDILGISESRVKKHVLEIFETLSVETRTAASLHALEVLSSVVANRSGPA